MADVGFVVGCLGNTGAPQAQPKQFGYLAASTPGMSCKGGMEREEKARVWNNASEIGPVGGTTQPFFEAPVCASDVLVDHSPTIADATPAEQEAQIMRLHAQALEIYEEIVCDPLPTGVASPSSCSTDAREAQADLSRRVAVAAGPCGWQGSSASDGGNVVGRWDSMCNTSARFTSDFAAASLASRWGVAEGEASTLTCAKAFVN